MTHRLGPGAFRKSISLYPRAALINTFNKDVGNFYFSSAAQSCLTPRHPMDCSTWGLPVHHQRLELPQTRVHQLLMPSNHLILCRPRLPSLFPSLVFKLNIKLLFFFNFSSVKYQLCFFSFYTNTSSCGIFLKVVPPSFEPDHLHRAGLLAISPRPWCVLFLLLWFQDKPLTFVRRSILWSETYMQRAYWSWLASSFYRLLPFEIFLWFSLATFYFSLENLALSDFCWLLCV